MKAEELGRIVNQLLESGRINRRMWGKLEMHRQELEAAENEPTEFAGSGLCTKCHKRLTARKVAYLGGYRWMCIPCADAAEPTDDKAPDLDVEASSYERLNKLEDRVDHIMPWTLTVDDRLTKLETAVQRLVLGCGHANGKIARHTERLDDQLARIEKQDSKLQRFRERLAKHESRIGKGAGTTKEFSQRCEVTDACCIRCGTETALNRYGFCRLCTVEGRLDEYKQRIDKLETRIGKENG